MLADRLFDKLRTGSDPRRRVCANSLVTEAIQSVQSTRLASEIFLSSLQAKIFE
jgi:hypothetical protein